MPPHAAYRLDSLLQSSCFHMAFSCPGAGKLYPVILAVRKIQAQAHRLQKMYRAAAMIHKSGASRDNSPFCKQSIQQLQFKVILEKLKYLKDIKKPSKLPYINF